MHRHDSNAFRSFFENGSFRAVLAFGLRVQLFDKATKRITVSAFITTRQVADPIDICENLIPSWTQGEDGMRAWRLQELVHRFDDRTPVSAPVKVGNDAPCFDNWGKIRLDIVRDRTEGMKGSNAMPISHQQVVRYCKQRASECRVHRQFIAGPLDRIQGRANCFNLFALMKRPCAPEQVRDIP